MVGVDFVQCSVFFECFHRSMLKVQKYNMICVVFFHRVPTTQEVVGLGSKDFIKQRKVINNVNLFESISAIFWIII